MSDIIGEGNTFHTPICVYCEHYTGDFTCEAFQTIIPDEIALGYNDHSKPLDNQGNDLIFKDKR